MHRHQLSPGIGLLVSLAAITLGGLGVGGHMDGSRLQLYRGSRARDPERHARGQRLGGALLVVFGVVGIATSLRLLM